MSGNVWDIQFDAEAGKLEETLPKSDVDVEPENMEDCHWLKTRNSSKKVIINLCAYYK